MNTQLPTFSMPNGHNGYRRAAFRGQIFGGLDFSPGVLVFWDPEVASHRIFFFRHLSQAPGHLSLFLFSPFPFRLRLLGLDGCPWFVPLDRSWSFSLFVAFMRGYFEKDGATLCPLLEFSRYHNTKQLMERIEESYREKTHCRFEVKVSNWGELGEKCEKRGIREKQSNSSKCGCFVCF